MRAISSSETLVFEQPIAESSAGAPPAWPALALALAATFIAIGISWDISWHETIGRDSFWTPAHMVIYLGGALGGCIGGWLAVKYTFFATAEERAASVSVFGARAPLGAWIAIWGAAAMLTSGPFDNWWHNAYGLDVKIISPPHAVLGFGMFGISFGALVLTATRQNRLQNGKGSGLFIWVGGVFMVLAGVFVMEYSFPNLQHAAIFYQVAALTFPFRLIAIGRAARSTWSTTRIAAIYMMIECLIIWILPLFPAQPRLAPIYNPVTHMVPPPFPLLLIVPAIVFDLLLRPLGDAVGWRRVGAAFAFGAAFLAFFIPAQWFFSEFILSPASHNWVFVGDRVWSYGNHMGEWTTRFWRTDSGDKDYSPMNVKSVSIALAFAAFTSWLGLLLGGWMRKVQR